MDGGDPAVLDAHVAADERVADEGVADSEQHGRLSPSA
jgi:hypothetical protein